MFGHVNEVPPPLTVWSGLDPTLVETDRWAEAYNQCSGFIIYHVIRTDEVASQFNWYLPTSSGVVRGCLAGWHNSISVVTNDGGTIIEFMLILNNHYLLLFVYICWSRDHIRNVVKDVICRLAPRILGVVECTIGLERLESVSYSCNDLTRWWRHLNVPGSSKKSNELSVCIV